MQVQAKIGIRQKFDWFYLVIGEFSVCNLGNYAVLTILAIYFVHSLNLPAAEAGLLLLFTSFSFRLSRLFLAPVADRFPIRQSIIMALLLTSAGYVGMTFTRIPLLVIFLLLIIGVGHSTNGLLVKTLAAQAKSMGGSNKSPFLRYAALTTGVNLAAAIGSILGGTLLFHWGPASVFLVAAISYGTSALIATGIPVTEAGKSQRINWALALRLTLRQPAIWRAMLFAFLGWFLYTQSYASLPIFVSEAVHRPDLLGSVFALNAVLVVAGQLPASKAIIYLRLPTSQSVLLAFLAFAGGFALLWFVPSWQIVYAAVALWTLAEMLLMPALDTLVAEGALVEYKLVAFAVYSIAVALGEGLGNLFGVSLAGSLLKSGNLSFLYTLLTFVAIAAMVVTVFAAKRRESIVFRLLNGQSLIPTGQTQLLHPQPEPLEKGGMTQSLLTWLSAGSYHDERGFFEAHPEIVALNTGQLEDFIEQHPEESGKENLSQRLNLLRDIRSRIAAFVRMAYLNMYGGLILDLPQWLEEIKQQLALLNKEGNPAQTAFKRMTLLHGAIKRARGERSIAPEIVAELQVLYAIAALEAQIPEHAEAVEAAIASLQEALKVYTLAQYPYQYARAQVFLSLAYQSRVKGHRRANLEQAIACYETAAEGYKSDPFPMQVAATHITGNNTHSQHMIEEKLTELEQAMAYCQTTLQDVIRQENAESEPTLRLRFAIPTNDTQKPLPEELDSDKTLHLAGRLRPVTSTNDTQKPLPEELDADKTLRLTGSVNKARSATHIEWIASQATLRLSPKVQAYIQSNQQKDQR